jgi:ArsR family transcriptional regulator, arsenate/arsenite/antimonite-responsive transcriptional repressor
MQEIFKALADPSRREIIFLLMEQEHSVKEMSEKLHIPMSTLSHHLDILYNSGLVTKRKKGTFIIYSPALSVLDELVTYVVKSFKKKEVKAMDNE